MTNLNEKISRRKFLQLTAGAAIGAAMLNVPGMTFAAGAKVKAANYNKLPDAVPLAKGAELVQLSYKKIQDAVSSIKRCTISWQLPVCLILPKFPPNSCCLRTAANCPSRSIPHLAAATQATMLILAGWQRIRPLTFAFPKAFTIPIRTFLTATSAVILLFLHRRCTIWQNRWYSSGRKTRLRCLNTPLPLPAHTIF